MRATSFRRILLVLLAGTGLAFGYRGDGVFVDRGPLTAHERFTLDLGEIDLTQSTRRVFRLAALPESEFALGLLIIEKTRSDVPLWDRRPLNPTIRLTVVDDTSHKVIGVEGPLKTWTWSGAVTEPGRSFLYSRGSYFKPSGKGVYHLFVETLSPDSNAGQFEIRLIAIGGGWK